MNRNHLKLRAADWVEVRSLEEIGRTLDPDGTLDGLPFMPEMIGLCGKTFRVRRRASKVCVEYPGAVYKMREFHNNDVVILDTDRCSGADHGDCQRACLMFWKTAWLKRVSAGRPMDMVARIQPAAHSIPLKTTSASRKYFCQSTALDQATRALTRQRVVVKCFEDVSSGSRGPLEMVRMVGATLRHYLFRPFRAPLRVGTLKRTPVAHLNLQPGELVQIKSEDEIVETLDANYRNRGLTCDRGMRTLCGGKFRVRHRLERMISEATGEMRPVEATVTLEGLQCMCETFHLGGCPREDLAYWREIWLERVADPVEVNSAAPSGFEAQLIEAMEEPASRPSAAPGPVEVPAHR